MVITSDLKHKIPTAPGEKTDPEHSHKSSVPT